MFIENIRYNALNYGLLNFTMKTCHLYFINNLDLSKLKILSKNFELKTTFNRAVLAENLINVYRRLAKRIVEEDENFFKLIAKRNQLLEQQERDKNVVEKVKHIMDIFRLNIPNLQGENLQTYIHDIGSYLQKIAYNINTPIPIQLKNKFYILIFVKEKEKERNEKVDMCPICYENKNLNCFITTNCNHAFCDECINSYIKTCSSENPPNCSLCRTAITTLYLDKEHSLAKIEEGLT
jgi:hypothetical protein